MNENALHKDTDTSFVCYSQSMTGKNIWRNHKLSSAALMPKLPKLDSARAEPHFHLEMLRTHVNSLPYSGYFELKCEVSLSPHVFCHHLTFELNQTYFYYIEFMESQIQAVLPCYAAL